VIEAVTWARDLGPAGLLALGVLAIASGVVILPRSVLSVVGGLTFGLWALPAIVIGSTLGASLAFMAARHVMRERLVSVIAGRPTLQAYLDSIDVEGWKVVLLLRLGSPFPGTALSYCAGMTRVRLHVFACATFIGIAPPVALYVVLGMAGRTALDGSGPEIGLVQAVLLGVGVITTITAAVLVSRAAKARLTTVPEPEEAADIDLGYLRLYDSALLPNDLSSAKSGSTMAIPRAQPTVHEPELASEPAGPGD
jgi:uncharacterized membrane protein YdjX (TVP38/TMEM64 family)